MFNKGSKLYSIFALKCPRCHEGETFETGSWSYVKPFEMEQSCARCSLNYFPEPGYYYGSMFISYIWTAWFCILFMAYFHWYLRWSTNLTFALLIAFLALNFVYIFRVSRLMWINLNVKYDPTSLK
jgi:uncharacterized protein (DUF983 family)